MVGIPTCSQTTIVILWKKRDFMVHHLGGLLSKKTFHWLLQSKEKPQDMIPSGKLTQLWKITIFDG